MLDSAEPSKSTVIENPLNGKDGHVSITFNRRSLFAAGGGALGAVALATSTWAAAPPRTGAQPRRRPNVILVLADDLGYGELGSFGQDKIKTPVLDRLAAEGVRYTNFYSGAPVCAPSRCTLLTGLHTGHATVRNNPNPGEPDGQFRDDEITFAKLLQASGYKTALFGKWGFSDDTADTTSHPNDHGFDEFYGFLTHIHAHYYYPNHLWHNRTKMDIPTNNSGNNTFAPDLFSQRALDFIEDHQDDPFLLFVSTQIPHSPQQIPSQGQYAGLGWGTGEAAHAAQVTYMDSDIGKMITKLEDLGIADDTVFIFMSDNGPHEEPSHAGIPFNPDFFDANGPLRGYKRNLHDGGIRVPAIIWAPGLMGDRAGDVVDQPLAMWDILPTLADLAGSPVPPFTDGSSIRHTFDDSVTPRSAYAPPSEDRSLYWWRVEPYDTARANTAEGGPTTRAAEAVRIGDWKALRFAPGKDRTVPDSNWDFRLHNLATDVGESTNLASSQPALAAAMLALMKEHWVDPAAPRPAWSVETLAIEPVKGLFAGGNITVAVVLTNHGQDPYTRIEVDLDVPAGWQVSSDRRNRSSVRSGQAKRFLFDVTLPAGNIGEVTLGATATFRDRATTRTETTSREVYVAAPAVTSFLSDMEWIVADNGWGPVERDFSNGRDDVNTGQDGKISLGGVQYDKGLGVHAPSRVAFALGGAYHRFTSIVGVDDFSANKGSHGSVIFQVWGDGVLLHDTGLRTAALGPVPLDIDIRGVERLDLVVTNGGNGNTDDHSSWANATVHVD